MKRRAAWIGSVFVALAALAIAGNWIIRRPASHVNGSAIPLGDREQCTAYTGLPEGWGRDSHAGMVRIRGGRFALGSERGYADERPLSDSKVAGFWIDRTEVTNAQFAGFVAATGYVTEVERNPGSAVFRAPRNDADVRPGSWWQLEKGADWRHPEGAGSSIVGRAHEPVVDVSHADALAYAHWLGRELPTEAQWEYAAKAARNNEAADRALRDADGRPLVNFWQGIFPLKDTAEDGFPGRAPVGCFPANPYGLYDMVGNVWEWTADIYHEHGTGDASRQDAGLGSEVLTRGGQAPVRRVIKGGSYLCSADYCARARASSRQPQEADLPASHLGFRTIAEE